MIDRSRLQVFLPAETVEALDLAAERYGLTRAEMVQHTLAGYLTHLKVLPPENATWPEMRPPPPLQRPITLPTRLVKWLRSQPGNMSDAVRQAVKRGMELEATGTLMGGPPTKWMTSTRRVNIRWPPDQVAVLRDRARRYRLGYGKAAAVYIMAVYRETRH